jgi:hypothetical protein
MPFNPSTAKLKFNPATARPKTTVKPSEERAMKAAQDRAAAGHDDNAFLQSLGSIANGASFGLLNTIDAGRVKLQTQVENLARNAKGKPQRFSSDEAYRATKKVNDQASAKFAASHPITNFTGNLMGGIIAPGVSKAAQWAGEAPTLFGQILRGATVGGVTGAAYGAGGAEDGQRLKGAEVGGLTGAAIGGTLPVVAAGVKTVAKPLVRTANKVINSATSGKVNILNPQREAMKSVAAALKRDGATPEQAKQITNEWLKTGASSPSLMDMASKLPSGGQATIGLVRGAALPSGPGRGAAIQYADQVASDLQGNAIGHARNLVPGEARSIPQIEEALQGTRAANAQNLYGEIYNQPIDVRKETLAALSDAPGRKALMRSRASAVANGRWDQVSEIDNMMGLQGEPVDWTSRGPQFNVLDALTGKQAEVLPQAPQVSGGTLDRARIQMRELAAQNARAGNNDMARGMFQRVHDIDSSMAAVPEFQPARADYANLSNQLDAIPEGALAANPAQNPAEFQALMQQRIGAAQPVGPIPATEAENAIRQSMQVGGARQMESQIGAAPEGALGYLKRLGTSTNAGQNLESLYGPDEAQRFQSAINNERLRVQNANSINPMNGSRTAVNVADTLDANTVGTAASALHGNFGPLLSKLISNPTLTDQEREQIVRLVLGQAQIPQVANANGSVISPYATGLAVQQQNRNGNQ